MTRSIRGAQRATLLMVGMAAVTSLLVSGCGAGQVAETAYKQSSIGGINAQTSDGTFKIRNAAVAYLSTEGYPVGGTAPLMVSIFNDQAEPVTVTVTTDSAQSIILAGAAASPNTNPSESASASPQATPSTSAGVPAIIEIPAGEFAQLNPENGNFLQLVGLNQALRPGNSVDVVFDFNGKGKIKIRVPVAVPLSPAPPASPIIPGHAGGDADEGQNHEG